MHSSIQFALLAVFQVIDLSPRYASVLHWAISVPATHLHVSGLWCDQAWRKQKNFAWLGSMITWCLEIYSNYADYNKVLRSLGVYLQVLIVHKGLTDMIWYQMVTFQRILSLWKIQMTLTSVPSSGQFPPTSSLTWLISYHARRSMMTSLPPHQLLAHQWLTVRQLYMSTISLCSFLLFVVWFSPVNLPNTY